MKLAKGTCKNNKKKNVGLDVQSVHNKIQLENWTRDAS